MKSTAIQIGSPIIDIGQQAFVDTGILRFDPEISFEFRVSYQTFVRPDRLQEFRHIECWRGRGAGLTESSTQQGWGRERESDQP